jgi:hypothetical protein
MPDAFAHFTITNCCLKQKNLKYLPEFLVGGLLPDLLGRVPCYFIKKDLYWELAPFHSPVMLLSVCYGISMFFRDVKERKKVFHYLFSGSMLHVIVDLMQLQFGSRVYYYFFFPFSFRSIQIPLFKHVDDSMYLFPLFLVTDILLYIKRKMKKA